MKIEIEIDLENDAFQPPNDRNYELWNILADWAGSICHAGPFDKVLIDSNGNRVGKVKVAL